MPDLRPFKGILYNHARVNPADVVAPPYDVIGDELRERLYKTSSYNIVRLDLSRDPDPYGSAAAEFRRWREEEILIKDKSPSVYVLTQDFRNPEGDLVHRRGFIAVCRLEEFSSGSVLPHEKTMPKPKEDRFKLMQATRANFSQIFALYDDADHRADEWLGDGDEPVADVEFEGIRSRLRRCTDEQRISSLRGFMKKKPVLIADGHHRYETSLLYRNTIRRQNARHAEDEPYNFVMMYLANLHDEGLMILPTHRLVHDAGTPDQSKILEGIRKEFEILSCPDEGEMVRQLDSRKKNAFGLVLPSGFHVFWLRNPQNLRSLIDSGIPDLLKDLDVTILHHLVLRDVLGISPTDEQNRLEFVKNIGEAVGSVREGRVRAAFIMNATPIDKVRQIAQAGLTMPQKSTYFYPKLLSGLVTYSLEEKD